MTYCAAWKKEDRVFLISDTAISQEKKESEVEIGSFGEQFGIYGNQTVKESRIKIVKINDKLAIAFSGVVKNAKEAIDNFKINIEYHDLETALKILEESTENSDFELIIVSHIDIARIYYFNGIKVREINNFIDIGSGKDKEYFSKNVSDYISSTNKRIQLGTEVLHLEKGYAFDEEEHLVNVLAYVQALSLNDHLILEGAGGLFFGLFIQGEVKWCKDLLYYIFDDDIGNFKSVSINERSDMVFSFSDYNNIFRCYSNEVGEYKDIRENKYLQNKLYKSLVESFTDYIILFDKSNGCIFVNKINKWPYNNFLKIWIKRNEENTKYAFGISYFYKIIREYIDNMNEDFKVYNIVCKEEQFIPREDYVGQFNPEVVDDLEVEYDYDLRVLFIDYDIGDEFIKTVDERVSEQHNIVIIDYMYLYDSILEKYNNYKFVEIDLNNLKLELLIDTFFINIASRDFDKYGFYVIKDRSDPQMIDNFSLFNWLSRYSNCNIYETGNGEARIAVAKFTLEISKRYYFDERYFGLDKLILCCDSKEVNEVLSYLPKKSFESENPDVILIRNINYYSCMDGRFKYVMIDYAVPFMLGYNLHEIGLLESGYDPKDEEYN